MKQIILTFLILLLPISTMYCQLKEMQSKFNFGFEKIENGIPVGWNNFGASNYIISLDSTNVRSGKYSASIEFSEGREDHGNWNFILPDNYNGNKITLTGYIKTENVSEGYAGLWMRIDPLIAFDNMHNRGVTGTTDWQKLEITLNMAPSRTEQIIFGGTLAGKGKIWLDDIEITIDGNPIQDLIPFERKVFPAEKDREFDYGSLITNFLPDKNKIDNLKTLGLIWGFLKYYHPNIAKGDYNWDYELFRVLPKILDSTNVTHRDEILVGWIKHLGEFVEEKGINPPSAEIKIKPDLDWINNSNFSEELSTLLLKVKNAKRTGDNYYIGLVKDDGNPEFKNEKPYFSRRFPDAGFRILSLYRYWNIIQYYFPYKNLIEEDWKDVLSEFIPKFINGDNKIDYTLNVLELMSRIHDTHANMIGAGEKFKKFFGANYAAVKLDFIENKVIVIGFYDSELGKKTGLKIGDIISKINNQPVVDIISDKLKYTPGSNYASQLRDIVPELLRSNDNTLNIEFIRRDILLKKTIKTYSLDYINIPSRFLTTDTCFKMINTNIAYINNGSLKKKDIPEVWNKMQNTKGLIIDIRNYPSDFPIYDLCNYLVPDSTAFVRLTNGSITHPGLFTFTKTLKIGKQNKNYYKGKVVILINEISQSSSEFHAMAYSVSPRATVIGSTTAGADGNVSKFFLPDGIVTLISGIGVYYPDGRETQRVGIVPDIEIHPTISGIKERKDELLEKAIKIINGK
ncbi:MAG: S41 family peptidase [Minisyncoccia bacterium]